jgi:tRNA (guanine-N7-)-methyltransferase
MKNKNTFGSLSPYLNCVDALCPMDWHKVFGNDHPLHVEIGFGTGEYIIRIARENPDKNFIGFEQCARRILSTLRKIDREKLKNVRLLRVDAAWAFEYYITPEALEYVHCLFPCPWPKKRHIKNRLFSRKFLGLINSRLIKGGDLRIITDHHPYAEWIMEELPGCGFEATRRMVPPLYETKFEKLWTKAGQKEFDELMLRKISIASGQVERSGKSENMKTFFIDAVDPRAVVFESYSREAAVEFKEFIFDEQHQKGIFQAIVTEDNRTQYLWLSISKMANGKWCLATTAGNCTLPTPGVQKAMELACEALRKSGL